MTGFEFGGIEDFDSDFAARVASIPEGQLSNFSEASFEAAKDVSKYPENRLFQALDGDASGNYPTLAAGRDDTCRFFTNGLWSYDKERYATIRRTEMAASIGASTVFYNLIGSDTDLRVIFAIEKAPDLTNYLSPAFITARNKRVSLEVGNEIKAKYPEFGSIFDFVIAKSISRLEIDNIFNLEPDVDLESFEGDPSVIIEAFDSVPGVNLEVLAETYRQSALTYFFAVAGALGLTDRIKPVGQRLEDQARIGRSLISYEQAIKPFQRSDFDVAEYFEDDSALHTLYRLYTNYFSGFMEGASDPDVSDLGLTFKEACFAGLNMLMSDRSLRQAVREADTSVLYTKARVACFGAFFTQYELHSDGGLSKKRLIKNSEYPLTGQLLEGIGMGVFKEFAENPEEYYDASSPDVGPNPTDKELDVAFHLPPGLKDVDVIDLAGVLLSKTIYLYLKQKEFDALP